MSTDKASQIFREKALSKLSSPDQLDHVITVTTPLGWFSLGTVGAVLLAALVWGFIGSIPTTISGQGILLRGGRIGQAVAMGSGQIGSLEVGIGDRVEVGQQVGTVLQPVKEAQVEAQQAQVLALRTNLDQVTREQQEQLDKQVAYYAEQRATARKSIADYQEQIGAYQRIVGSQQKLLDQGLITEVSLLNTRNAFYQAQLSLLQSQNTLAQLDAQEVQARNSAEQAIFTARNAWQQAEDSLNEFVADLEQSSRLVCPFSGRVADVSAYIGQSVVAGAAILAIENTNEPLHAVMFFPAGKGKKTVLGMKAQVSPGTAQAEEFGFMVGRVLYVGDVPVSSDSVRALLQNDTLVNDTLKDGPAVRITAELIRNPDTVSGYQWSSSKGPPIQVTAGTVCSAQIIVLEQPPITLVIPLLKKFFGIKD